MKIDRKEWAESLVPYKKFHATYAPKDGWVVKSESIIPRNMNLRIKIVIESNPNFDVAFLDHGRYEALAEQNIWDADIDTIEFAEDLLAGNFGDHMSIRDIEGIIEVFQKYVDDWHARRDQFMAEQAALKVSLEDLNAVNDAVNLHAAKRRGDD